MLIKQKRIPIKEIILYGFLPSFLKKLIYRLKGYKIGKNVRFGLGSVLLGENVRINDNVSIGMFTLIRAKIIKIDRYSTIGMLCFIDTQEIIIGEDTRIREQVLVGGINLKESLLKIGDRCLIMQFTNLNPTYPIIIGNDTAIGGHSLLFTHSSWLSELEGFPVVFGRIEIGDKVWIPWRTFISSNVKIGDYVIIQPNSLVNMDIPEDHMYSSNPQRVVPNFFHRKLSQEKKDKIIKKIINSFVSQFNTFSNYENLSYCFKLGANYNLIFDIHEDKKWADLDKKVVVSFNKMAYLKQYYKNKDLLLSLDDNCRLGSNELGETFVNFLSHYGIRFKRK